MNQIPVRKFVQDGEKPVKVRYGPCRKIALRQANSLTSNNYSGDSRENKQRFYAKCLGGRDRFHESAR